jgi:cation diffusion facilitator CzcD-associated flavoprotein CzcO
VIVGAGFGGLAAAVALRRKGIDDLLIIERADGVGGTWRQNIYPGAACDIQSHLYSFSFAPNRAWSRTYAYQPEILAYLETVADDFDLRRHLILGSCVRRLAGTKKRCTGRCTWPVATRTASLSPTLWSARSDCSVPRDTPTSKGSATSLAT